MLIQYSLIIFATNNDDLCIIFHSQLYNPNPNTTQWRLRMTAKFRRITKVSNNNMIMLERFILTFQLVVLRLINLELIIITWHMPASKYKHASLRQGWEPSIGILCTASASTGAHLTKVGQTEDALYGNFTTALANSSLFRFHVAFYKYI